MTGTKLTALADYFHPLAAPFRLDGERSDTVMLLHGWTGSPAHLRELGGVINEAGFTVIAPLLAGHGTTLEDMALTGWRDWVRSALAAAGEFTDRPIHLVGLSMGGVISLLLAPVLSAASVTTINAPQVVYDRRMRLAPAYRGSSRIEPADPPEPASFDVRQYQQQYNGTPVGTVAELRDLIRAARRNLKRVTCPALVIQSKADETVKPQSAEIIYDGVGSVEKGLLWLEDSRHVATLDEERHVIAEAILEHLESAGSG